MHQLSRINYNGKHTKHFKIDIAISSTGVDLSTKKIFIYGSRDDKNIMMLMNYNGQKKEIAVEGTIQAFAMFANIIYSKSQNNSVINVMNGDIKEEYQNIPLFRQWRNLSYLMVMDNIEQSIGELYS